MSTPMIDTHTVTLTASNGVQRTFEMRRLGVLKIAALSMKISSKILPLFSGLKVGMDDDTAKAFEDGGIKGLLGASVKFDGAKAVESLCGSLESLDEEVLTKIACDLFSMTSCYGVDGLTKIPVDRNSLSIVTEYDLGLMLRLAVEVVEFNQFPFIGSRAKELIGFATRTMNGLDKQIGKIEENPKTSEN